jgi:phage baseplate assembly protein V
MKTSLVDLLMPPSATHRIHGVVVGIVTNNQDPEALGRVKVRFPWLSGDDESDWARMATLMAGNGRGAYFLPEVDDEVLVAFEHGDPRFPYVLGALWNGRDAPPEPADRDNNRRTLKSRSGHVIRLDDTADGEKIEIIGSGETCRIILDAARNTLTIEADADLTVRSANGKLTLGGQEVEINARGNMSIQGQTVNIN